MKKRRIKGRYFYAIVLACVLLLLTKIGYDKQQGDVRESGQLTISEVVQTAEPEKATEQPIMFTAEPVISATQPPVQASEEVVMPTDAPTGAAKQENEKVQGEEIMAKKLSGGMRQGAVPSYG